MKKSRQATMLGSFLLLMMATALTLLPLQRYWSQDSWLSSAGCHSWACGTLFPSTQLLPSRHNIADDHLAHEEENPACLSREQHRLYLPALPAPSTSLSTALAAYDRLHADCLMRDGTTALNFTSADILRESSSLLSCKYLIYIEGPAGLGNRIMAVVSAFLYAVLTDRVLLVDARGHLCKLLCEPFSKSSWLVPEGFPYELLEAAARVGEAMERSQLNAVHLQLQHDQSAQDQIFWDVRFQEKLRAVPWIAWSSNQYLVPRLFSTPTFWPRLAALFPADVSLTFSQLGRRILLPRNAAWESVLNAYWAYLSGSAATVGVQVRQHFVQDEGRVFSRTAHERIMECLTTNTKILPKVNSTQDLILISSRKSLAPKPWRLPKKRRVTVMVASLQAGYYEEMKESFLRYRPIAQALEPAEAVIVGVHTLSHEEQEQHSWTQALKAFVEMWVLSMCEELAISSWSTFGYVARGLRGRPSWILHVRGDQMRQQAQGLQHAYNSFPVCSLGQSPDPCNHFPFLHATPAPSNHSQQTNYQSHSSMQGWVKRHLKPCLDEPRGIQLVD